jgi:hypothetical protein
VAAVPAAARRAASAATPAPQQPVGNDIWVALAWCVGILVVAYVFAMKAYRRKMA